MTDINEVKRPLDVKEKNPDKKQTQLSHSYKSKRNFYNSSRDKEKSCNHFPKLVITQIRLSKTKNVTIRSIPEIKIFSQNPWNLLIKSETRTRVMQ